MGSRKVESAKENSRIHLKIQKYPRLGKKHKDPKNIPQWIGSKNSIPQWIRNCLRNSLVS